MGKELTVFDYEAERKRFTWRAADQPLICCYKERLTKWVRN